MQEKFWKQRHMVVIDYSFIYCFYYIPGYFFPYLIFVVFNTAIPWEREYYSYFSAEEIEQEWPSN